VRFGENIYVQYSYRGTGVEYHEAMHKLFHRSMRDALGSMFNEGVTEYFTWHVIGGLVADGHVVRDEAQYGPQRSRSPAWSSEDVLARVYFAGACNRCTTGSPS
jgi:hypothetical protein